MSTVNQLIRWPLGDQLANTSLLSVAVLWSSSCLLWRVCDSTTLRQSADIVRAVVWVPSGFTEEEFVRVGNLTTLVQSTVLSVLCCVNLRNWPEGSECHQEIFIWSCRHSVLMLELLWTLPEVWDLNNGIHSYNFSCYLWVFSMSCHVIQRG